MSGTEILFPATLTEAVQLLRRPNVTSAILAGGTQLAPRQRARGARPLEALISLRDLKLAYIKSDSALLHIGAATTLEMIVKATECSGLLAQAARAVTSLNLRNSATLGGTLVTASGGNPLPAALLVLDATLTLYSPEARQTPLDSFMNYRERLIQDGALIAEIAIPLQRMVAHAAYDQVARTPADSPIVYVAAAARTGIGHLSDVRIAVAGAAPIAIRLPQAEQLLEGKPLTDELVEQAAGAAARSVTPSGDHIASADYRREMVRVLVRRALSALR